MSRLDWLAEFTKILMSAVKWLDVNFERMLVSLIEQCPEAPKDWIANRIVTLAIDGVFDAK